MEAYKLDEAREKLEDLMRRAASGEEVVISTKEGEAFRLVPLAASEPRPRFGSARGLVRIGDDFDEPVPGFESYTE